MDLRAIRGKFSEQGKIDLEKSGFRARLDRSLKLTERFPSSTQSNVWELRENRRRLRHCDGYNSQCHCPWGGKAGKGLKPKSGYRLDCARQPRTFRGTSPQREGWGQPGDPFSPGLVECLHSRFAEVKAFFLVDSF
jgi:hypothetical protein